MKIQAITIQQNLDKSSQKRANFWQVLETKSAFSEGVIAQDLLFWNQFNNLRISAKLFHSVKSPLENFLSNEYLSPIKTELDYIEQRVRLISKCKKLMTNYSQNSIEFEDVKTIVWLLKFQLYGFGQKLVQEGKLLYGLIALKESEVLKKSRVREKLQKLADQKPNFAQIISEFL